MLVDCLAPGHVRILFPISYHMISAYLLSLRRRTRNLQHSWQLWPLRNPVTVLSRPVRPSLRVTPQRAGRQVGPPSLSPRRSMCSPPRSLMKTRVKMKMMEKMVWLKKGLMRTLARQRVPSWGGPASPLVRAKAVRTAPGAGSHSRAMETGRTPASAALGDAWACWVRKGPLTVIFPYHYVIYYQPFSFVYSYYSRSSSTLWILQS